ncbi:MAG: arginine deiminase [Coriobacteriales bacterium]|nr:arginine deiminase [Coriobacteriales bacterium]
MAFALNVHNEIGRLRQVMLHRPGEELLNLSPSNLEPLLFDDIPFLEVARAEHDAFAHMLKEEGVQVLYLEDLVSEALDAVPSLRRDLTDDYLRESGLAGVRCKAAVRERLDAIGDTHAFVNKLIAGIRRDEVNLDRPGSVELADFVGTAQSGNPDLLVDPLPNLYFSRDTFMVSGHGVILNRMYSVTRQRETLLGQVIFSRHERYRDVPQWYRRTNDYHIEGGDFLNLSARAVAVGISQRTQSAAIDLLAKNMFWGGESRADVEEIYAFLIPDTRAMMHLDTVFTQLDVDAFLLHPGILDTLEVFRVTRGAHAGELRIAHMEDSLDKILAQALGLDAVRIIRCGGNDAIAASREQWNDGSNTLAVSPGRVFVYQRNAVTNEILYNAGFELLEIPSAELSRGRGGPHCMSMPFWRDDL